MVLASVRHARGDSVNLVLFVRNSRAFQRLVMLQYRPRESFRALSAGRSDHGLDGDHITAQFEIMNL